MEGNKPSSWYIPRASLSSNTSNGTGKDRSTEHKYHRDSVVIDFDDGNGGGGYRKHSRGIIDEPVAIRKYSSSSSSSELSERQPTKTLKSHRSSRSRQEEPNYSPKRFSRSSQGSTDSTHSASSLLLTVKNLENFAKIHEVQKSTMLPLAYSSAAINKNYPNNLIIENKHLKLSKTKECDELSEASSMHFTVVNEIVGPTKPCRSETICKRSHQVTIVIMTMTILFCIAIFFTILMMELRAREMPR